MVLYLMTGAHSHAHEEPSHQIKTLSAAIHAKPDDSDLRLRRARLYREAGQWKRALRDVTKAHAIAGKVPSPAIELEFGLVWLAGANPERAIHWLSRAIRRIPNVPEAWQGRGDAWAKQGKYDKAIADYTQALSHQPTPQRFIQRAQWQEKVGQIQQAIAGYNEGLRRLNFPITLRLSVIRLYIQTKNTNAALAHIEALQRKHPHAAEWPLRRGDIHCHAGQVEASRNAYNHGLSLALKSLQRRPSALAQTHHAWALVGLGNRLKAEGLLRSIRSQHPRLTMAQQLQERLSEKSIGCGVWR